MNKKLEKFLATKKETERKLQEKTKQDTLIDLGLFEKVYSPNNAYSDEYCFSEMDSDNQTSKYYKKVAIEITDEEYQEVKKYAKVKEPIENPIAMALTIIAWVIFIGGFFAGIILGIEEVEKGYYYTYTETEFSFAVALTYWGISLVSGTMFLGFAEIIKLLEAIKRK